MKINRTIQCKACFLLMVFSLNTLVGFACSVGLDMGFNTSHNEASVHIHKDGKKHIHHNKKDASKKDNCCNEKIFKIQTGDKNLQYAKTNIPAPVYFSAAKKYNNVVVLINTSPSLRQYKACHFHPPPDIRIAIQSFQI